MTLGEKKTKFTSMVALLIQFAIEQGYEIRFCPEHNEHMLHSLHYIGLAKDFELFLDGKYLTESRAYLPLGLFWEDLGGTWGGRFSSPDGCHFSYPHDGKR